MVAGRRIGQVVGRHVHRLERRDRALLGGGDALLQRAHLGGQRRLVADGAGGAAEQRRDLGAGLREAEDVVDEEQHVLVLLVAEVLGDGEAGERDAQTRAGRLVHLAVDERDLRRAQILLVDDAGLRHLVVQVVAFARALADAGEHRHAAVQLGDVVDQLHDDDGLADAGAAERADLAALQERADQIDHLDAGREHLRRRRLIDERRRRAVNRVVLLGHDRAALVDRGAGHVEHASHDAGADRHADRPAAVGDLEAALESFGARHRDGADPSIAEVLLHFERQRHRLILDRVLDGQGVGDRRQRAGKRDVHHRTDDLHDRACVHTDAFPLSSDWPPAISSSSCVMCPWRSLL